MSKNNILERMLTNKKQTTGSFNPLRMHHNETIIDYFGLLQQIRNTKHGNEYIILNSFSQHNATLVNKNGDYQISLR